jgi:DNA-binding transcriptional regulator GbsR (MarR family)
MTMTNASRSATATTSPSHLNGDAGSKPLRMVGHADNGRRRETMSVEDKLREVQDNFIRRWGEMGATWGINRTQAEIHAFLFITGRPQCTDDVMERLNISRGNASMSLRALCDWGIIRRFHRRGERREYFESLTDVWEMFSIIAAERKRREMDPVLETIRQCEQMLSEAELGKAAARDEEVKITRQRLAAMGEFMSITNQIFEQFIKNAQEGLRGVAKIFLKAVS